MTNDNLDSDSRNLDLAPTHNVDPIVTFFFNSIIVTAIEIFSDYYRIRHKLTEVNDRDHATAFANWLLSQNLREADERVVRFILKSYLWFDDERLCRPSVKDEAGYTTFVSGLCEKYATTEEVIENGEVRLEVADRLALNDMFRACEKISWRRFNEDTAFAVEVVKMRREIYDFLDGMSVLVER